MKPTFTVRLPKPLIDAIKARASEDGSTQSKVVQDLLSPHFPSPALAPVERAADSPVHPPASPTSLPREDASPTVEVDRESSDDLIEAHDVDAANNAEAAFQQRVKQLSRTLPRATAERIARMEARRVN